MRDISDAKDSTIERVLNALLQSHPMNAFLMDEARMEGYAAGNACVAIDHLMAYVTPPSNSRAFIEKRASARAGADVDHGLRGAVTDEARSTLTRVFSARVHNKYGSRECADMACECAAGGFHIYHTGVHLEVVDEADQARA